MEHVMKVENINEHYYMRKQIYDSKLNQYDQKNASLQEKNRWKQSDDVAICNKNRTWPHLKSNRAKIYITSTVTRKLGWKKSVPKLNLLLISSSTFLLIFLPTVWWISFSSEAFCLLLSWNYYHTTAHPRSVCFTLLFLKQHTSLDKLSYKY